MAWPVLERRLKFVRRLFSRTRAINARVPDGVRIYAIGDIHGRADLLSRMERLILADLHRSPHQRPITVFLGDYIDRGPDSFVVVDRLAKRLFPTPHITLRGNHESMLLGFLSDPDTGLSWRDNGGLETLHSYGMDLRPLKTGSRLEAFADIFRRQLPPAHLEFFSKTRLAHQVGDYFFCHAGVRPGVGLDNQKEQDILWIRNEFLTSEKDFGKVIVHGHSPVSEPELRWNRINVDTGAYISGRLTAVVLERDEQRFLSTM